MTRKECEEKIIEHLKAIREITDEYMPGLFVSMHVGKLLNAFAFEPGEGDDRKYVIDASYWLGEEENNNE